MPEFFAVVNLSPRQFGKGLVSTIPRCLIEAGLPASALKMEITEGLPMHDAAAAMPIFDTPTTLGVRISIDDLGMGYSSLPYL